jgi:preprotein translocase subunit YajC
MVARAEMIDPKKFGVTVAANSGLVGDVFESEEKALAWLRSVK